MTLLLYLIPIKLIMSWKELLQSLNYNNYLCTKERKRKRIKIKEKESIRHIITFAFEYIYGKLLFKKSTCFSFPPFFSKKFNEL